MEESRSITNDEKQYRGQNCRISEMEIGDTLFTVISVESKEAKETAYEKLKKQILTHAKEMAEIR